MTKKISEYLDSLYSSCRVPRNLTVLLLCIFFNIASAQSQVSVRGKVMNEKGEALPGATVQVKGNAATTQTKEDGMFIVAVPGLNATLICSFAGFQTKEIGLAGRSEINIVLSNNPGTTLSDVVVIGYGTQKRDAVTTSVTKLDTRVLENIPYANIATAMQGTMPGVKVQTTSGQPGSAPRVIVRGGTSINNPNGAAPLTIVDGVIRTMSNLSTDDIESVQVLKDAASTAIYGARGSNGVVLITTKSGKAGKTQVTYSYDLTASDVDRLPQLASAEEYIRLGRLGTVSVARKLPAYLGRLNQPLGYGVGNDFTKNTDYTTQYLTEENKGKLNEGWQSMPDPVDPSKTIIFKETDFLALALQRGISHNHHIGVSGGTEKATFNAGIGYLTSDGTAITTFYKSLTANLNGDIRVNDKLKFFGRTLFGQAVDNRLVSDSYTFWGAGTRPTAKYAYEDGTLAPGRINQGNPAYHMRNRDAENRTYNITLSTGANWGILPGLTFDPIISLNTTMGYSRSFQPAYGNGSGTVNSTRTATASDSRSLQTQADAVFSYTKSIASNHNLDAKAGFSYFKRSNYSFAATGQGASTDLIPTLNASGQLVSMSSTLSDQVILGYFSRINYDFQRKYLLSLNMRYDGASNLGANHKWGFFPGISAGWNVDKEKFWKALPNSFSRLKLRASYGINGNISGLGDFTAQGVYDVGGQYAGGPVIKNTGIPNSNLQWEQSKTLNFGTDVSFFGNRINILFDVFRRVTDNLLTTLNLPSSTGFTGILTNYGSLENRGVELELNANVLPLSSDFQWNVAFNAAKVKNKILHLPANGVKNNRVGGYYVWDPGKKDYDWLGGLQEGGRIGDYYVYKQTGVYATDAEAANAPTDMVSPTADKTKHGGDVIWLDNDGNGVIDTKDMVYVGNQYPVWTGGFSSYFTYRNLSLSIRMDYTTGHTIYNYGRAFYDINLDGDNVMTKRMAELSWKEQGDITNVPRYDWQDASEYNIRRGNSEYYESGDYLALREVTIGYTLPVRLLQRLKINNLRLNVTGNNLHYFTKFQGLNPEDGGQEFGRYPIPRNIIFGLNITL